MDPLLDQETVSTPSAPGRGARWLPRSPQLTGTIAPTGAVAVDETNAAKTSTPAGYTARRPPTILRLIHGRDEVVDRRAPAPPPGRLGLAATRAIDLLGATTGLLVLGPLLLGTAALIALVDGRPVLFRQHRAGLDERPFRIYKFRTMRAGADAERAALRANNEVAGGASFKMTDDPRVTRLGRFLRRTSIDEFPQLLNVLQGEMSLVGPRPHPFDDIAGYQPWHHARTAMKPGMTGLWQVSSRRDPEFDHWVELDLEYIRTWSPWLDIKIIARTVPAMVRSEGR